MDRRTIIKAGVWHRSKRSNGEYHCQAIETHSS
jgi:hypothetical protein